MFFKKQKNTAAEDILKNFLIQEDLIVIAMRGKRCDVIFSNAAARDYLGENSDFNKGCEISFAKNFSDLCKHCPMSGRKNESDSAPFEIEDKSGRTYMASCNTVDWFDGEPATALFMRNITKEKENSGKLYTLAYIDQLTGVPNRRKLQDDFNALEEQIVNGTVCGAVALFDLDHFKVVNDTYGHNTGDLILRRLTEHLQENSAFAGHLYRLGGDEFVLLYSEPPDRFDSETKMSEYYRELLETALNSYTLPNIEVSCTLSMGISLFPKHGLNLSEILRKADIAMYQSKANGRDQVTVFQDEYDTAKKFKDLFVNLQPVLYASRETFGYDLVDRGSDGEGGEDTVKLSGVNRAFDVLGLDDIENDQQYFISFSPQLLNPIASRTLPKNKFIVQMAIPDGLSKSDMQTYLELKRSGYKLALTGLNTANAKRDILSVADYCKFDDKAANIVMQKRIIEEYPKIKFIATGVDSPADFQKARNAGFVLFQGFFFNQYEPEVVKKTKDVGPMKVNYLRLLKLCSAEGYMDFSEISTIISSDVALTYKLLRILSSAAVGARHVTSISMAVAFLGEENLKKWISVLALRGVGEDQPLEIIRMSLIRARFGELLAPHFPIRRDPKQIFMVGMLSLLHIALDISKNQLLEDIPVSEEVRDSILLENGVYSSLLRFFENYEYSNWDDVSQFIETNKLDVRYVNDSYIAAAKWYNDLTKP
ncbi:MAG: diguanylate cyclase [Oscillospiraceae bacterium]|nr:diguanylate cyclase [Oscillospiraceae bacterium]